MAESGDPAAESVDMEVKIPNFLNYKTDCRLYSDLYPCGGYLYALSSLSRLRKPGHWRQSIYSQTDKWVLFSVLCSDGDC